VSLSRTRRHVDVLARDYRHSMSTPDMTSTQGHIASRSHVNPLRSVASALLCLLSACAPRPAATERPVSVLPPASPTAFATATAAATPNQIPTATAQSTPTATQKPRLASPATPAPRQTTLDVLEVSFGDGALTQAVDADGDRVIGYRVSRLVNRSDGASLTGPKPSP
jgi:hypothetical protein